MRLQNTLGKRTILFLSLTFSLLSVCAQKSQDPSHQRAIDLLHKNLRTTGLNQSVVDSYVVTDAYPDKKAGTFMVYLQQTFLGVPVYNKIGVFVFRDEQLVEKKLDYIARLPLKAEPRSISGARAAYAVSAVQAIRFAAIHLAIPPGQEPRLLQKDDIRQRFVYAPSGVSEKNINADLVWLPLKDSTIKLSWNVRIVTQDGQQDWTVRVDAQTGEVLEKSNRVVSENAAKDCIGMPNIPFGGRTTSDAKAAVVQSSQTLAPPPSVTDADYEVYPFPLESANFGVRSLEHNPWLKAGAGNNAATLGWHFDGTTNYNNTRGNNVWALEDIEGTDQTTGVSDVSSTPIPGLTFNQVLDPAMQPTFPANMGAEIDNLFYWNNLMHDISYQYGFDEAAGNFQASNQGRGGQENDFVHAFAEDGQGLNNANFSTPPDGENPVMRMFQWNLAATLHFHVNAPGPVVGDYTAIEGSINLGSQLSTTGNITGDIVEVDDQFASTHLACSSIGNAASLVGKIALIDRGTCGFVVKIKNAQNAGAIAVLMVNTVGQPLLTMGGADATITIPAIMISNTDGALLRANPTGLNGTLSVTGVNRDGTLDAGIMSHEYTHGISNRLTGGPTNVDCLQNAEQMGEGWSDYVALMVTTNWSTAAVTDGPKPRPIGTYVLSEPTTAVGIRRYPYSTDLTVNRWRYDSLATVVGGEPHTIGEIWCATIWDMTWNIIQMEGIDPDIYHGTKGNNIALQLVIEGLKLQPCSPGFLDGRDAILKADSLLYNSAHKCAIWNAFARRGMGKSALQGSSNSFTDQTPANDLPMGAGISQTVDKSLLVQGDNVTYTIKATCDCAPLSGISIVDTLSTNLAYVTSTGGTFTAPYVHFDGLSFTPNEVKTLTIQATVLGTYTAPDTLINDSEDPSTYAWTPTIASGSASWVVSTARSHSTSHSWFAADPSSATSADFSLVSGDLVLDTVSTLSFWHFYEAESTFDGGVVEITTNGGTTWQDLGPFMTQNGYNNTLDPGTAGIPNRQAFSGSSGGFVQTIIPITGFAGKTVRIRFRFGRDAVGGAEGWYIDDIQLTNANGAGAIGNAFNGGTLLSNSRSFSLFAPVPLPVNFLSFDARKQSSASAALHWRVNGEISVAKYIVQRSGDNNSFTAIGEVADNPLGSGTKDYVFTDNQPLEGNNFYRILEKDLDGKPTYSGVKLLQFAKNSLLIRLSPVPTFNQAVQLELETGDDQPAVAYLLNTVGQTVRVYSVKQGTNTLDLTSFAKGMYFLRIQTSRNNTEIRKIVIQ